MARVEFDRVFKRFGKVDVVQDISFDIKDREFMVLVGPSGCGKSTCLRMVAGLEEPTDGEIRIGDRVVNGVDPKDRDIAMVFQNYALYPHMSVFDNMAFGLKLRKVPKDQIKQKVEEAAGLLGLENLLKRKPKELSGGQRQRVALGRAIVRNAQVFLMDEPLSNLDAKLRVETRANIIRLHQQIQTTTIYVTHDQVEAMTMGDRIAVLNGGKIQQLGTPQDLYDRPSNIFVAGFIGTPSMNFFPKAKVVSEGDSATIVLDGVGQVKVPAEFIPKAREAASKDSELTFGIRPVHLKSHELAGSNGASTINANIDVVENLGNELQVYFTTGNQTAIATLDPGSFVRVGDKIKLFVNSAHVHLFDTETGESYF